MRIQRPPVLINLQSLALAYSLLSVCTRSSESNSAENGIGKYCSSVLSATFT